MRWPFFCLLLAGLCLAKHLDVFVIPHSHQDPGWIHTMDEYYDLKTRDTLITVVENLLRNPSRRFNYAETSFLAKFWEEDASPVQKEQIKMLARNGQLEFINGGYVMHSEAVCTYNDMINQMTLGHEFLLEHLDVKPRVAWHIDPFGASSVSPVLFADMGFDAFVINRIPKTERTRRRATQTLEFVWRGGLSRTHSSDMWTHDLCHHYCTPIGFNFQGSPYTDPPITPENAHERAAKFVDICRERGAWFKHNALMIPFGCDFTFKNATVMYENMDKLIDYINAHSAEFDMRIQYGSVSEYVDHVHALDLQWGVVKRDFFPYFDNPHSFWTGFYASRPYLKGLSTRSSALLHGAELAHVTSALATGSPLSRHVPLLDVLRRAVALMQHHDAITGTEKQFVAEDYIRRLRLGRQAATRVAESSANALALWNAPQPTAAPPRLARRSTLQGLAYNRTAVVSIQNTLGWARRSVVRIVGLPRHDVIVRGPFGKEVYAQVNPDPAHPGTYAVYVFVTVPSLATTTLFIEPAPSDGTGSARTTVLGTASNTGRHSIANKRFVATFNAASGRLASVQERATGDTMALQQDYLFYECEQYQAQTSGAYIFQPDGPAAPTTREAARVEYIRGPFVEEAVQTIGPAAGQGAFRIVQATRLYTDPSPEEDHTVSEEPDSLDVEIDVATLPRGRELITRFTTGLESNGRFIADLNGIDMHVSKRDMEEEYFITRNYRPSVAAVELEHHGADGTVQQALRIATDRAHGAASLQDGDVELMLHRRTAYNDHRGVEEALNDKRPIHARLRIAPAFYVHGPAPQLLRRRLPYLVAHPLRLLYTSAPGGWERYTATYRTTVLPLQASLPDNVHLQALSARGQSNEVVMRLAHMFASNESALHSAKATIDLHTLFSRDLFGTLESVLERTLSLNRAPRDLDKRLQWSTSPSDEGEAEESGALPVTDAHRVEMLPQRFRTFLLRFAR
eukprot:gnl/Trimastix_PCT/936.p1 GENE.gnl/Trimastix_PCT/936~~gnl/Trimastix_PCT/936.p1  ORF type:complete len:968 (+),score=289.54 gnl/Trimastix_PCT/936:140-3043(+)